MRSQTESINKLRQYEFVNEKIINNRKRVQNHGEVFTPKRIVKNMLNLPSIRKACENITSTFLEPAAGEGIFLVEILKKKLNMVARNYGSSLIFYENYSLLALSTLYGVELLEDNVRKCVMNMYQTYYEVYMQQANKYGKNMKFRVLSSAKLIISRNILQGNFLTKVSASGQPLVFSKWEALDIDKGKRTITIQRTDYSLQDILRGTDRENGEVSGYEQGENQLSIFNMLNNKEDLGKNKRPMKYLPVKITDLYKEEKGDL